MKTWFVVARFLGKLLLLCLIVSLPCISFAAEEVGVKSDKEMADWVEKVAGTIRISNQIEIVQTDKINAWTMEADDKIYITSGLLAFCQSDDELAGVLLHEIGHQALDHFGESRRHQEEMQSEFELYARMMRGYGADSMDALRTSAKVISAASVPYFGHKYEYAADKYSYDSLCGMGMDRMALAKLFARMAKSDIDSKLFSLLLSHPSFSSRIGKFEGYEREWQVCQFPNSCLRLKPGSFSQAVAQGNMAGYQIVTLKEGKKMNFYLFLPENSGLFYKKGTLEMAPGAKFVVLIKETGTDQWVEVGLNVKNYNLYIRNSDGADDCALAFDSTALIDFGPNKFGLYYHWMEQTAKGTSEVSDSMTIKLAQSKNPVTISPMAGVIKPEEVIGPLYVLITPPR